MAAPEVDLDSILTDDRALMGRNLRDEIAQKRIQKKIDDEANYTFHPTLPPRKSLEPSCTVAERCENLHKNTSKRTRKSAVAEEFSFSPEISSKAKLISRDQRPEDFINTMHTSIGSGKLPIQEEVIETFSPKINKRPNSPKELTPKAASERLYGLQRAMRERLERKREEVAQREAKECTFSPTVSPKSKLLTAGISDSIPVSDRLNQYGIEKAKKREAMAIAQANKVDVHNTFQPTFLTPRKESNVITTIVSSDSDSHLDSRNGVSPVKLSSIRKRQADNAIDAAAIECTFSPQISARARAMNSNRSTAEHVIEMHHASGAGRLDVSSLAEELPTFTPVISKLGSSMDRASSGSITDHLYMCKDAQEHRLEVLKYEAAVKVLGDCTFAPRISEKSKYLSSTDSGDVVDRLLDFGLKKNRKLEEEQSLKAEADMADVTFQPNIIKTPSRHVCETYDYGNQFDRLYEDAKKRDARNSRQEGDTSTFQPEISDMAKNMNRSKVADINQRQIELKQRKREGEVAQRQLDETFSHMPTISRRASSIDKYELEEMLIYQKSRAQKKKDETALEMERENTFTPRLPSRDSYRQPSPTLHRSDSDQDVLFSNDLPTPPSNSRPNTRTDSVHKVPPPFPDASIPDPTMVIKASLNGSTTPSMASNPMAMTTPPRE